MIDRTKLRPARLLFFCFTPLSSACSLLLPLHPIDSPDPEIYKKKEKEKKENKEKRGKKEIRGVLAVSSASRFLLLQLRFH